MLRIADDTQEQRKGGISWGRASDDRPMESGTKERGLVSRYTSGGMLDSSLSFICVMKRHETTRCASSKKWHQQEFHKEPKSLTYPTRNDLRNSLQPSSIRKAASEQQIQIMGATLIRTYNCKFLDSGTR